MNKLVINNLISLKNGSRLRKNYVECYYNKFFLRLVLFFYQKNFIIGYTYVSKYKIRIFLKYYKDKGVFDNVVIPKRLNKTITYSKLNYLKERSKIQINTFIIILTSKGFFLLNEFFQLNLKMGGLIFCILYL